MIDIEKWDTNVVKALQIARASDFYSQFVWSLAESVSQMDNKKNPKLLRHLQLFLLSKQGTCLKTAGRTWNSFFMLTLFLFDLGWVGINFVGIWLWITMPPWCKLSTLDCGQALAWLSDSVWNCCWMIERNWSFSKLPMDFVVCIFQRSVHVALNFLWLVYTLAHW